MIGGVSKETPLSELDSVARHRDRVAALLPSTPVRRRPLADCAGLALAEDLIAALPLPPFDNTAMDGYAVRAADLAEAGPERPVALPVSADVPAGRTDVPALEPGTAHRIMTGALLPEGADAIVPVERTDGGTATVRIGQAPQPGAHVRRAGEDVTRGSVVLPAGTELHAARLGVAAAVGADPVAVREPPRVLVLSTGSELVEPGKPLQPGQIYESNGIMIADAVRAAGGSARLLRFVPDNVDELHRALDEELDGTDLIITSGGVSAGAYEVVKDALAEHGVTFHKIAMQPGMPQGCGRYRDRTAVVTLPGNPVSAMVSFEVFVRPALRAAAGHSAIERPQRRAAITEDLTSTEGKRQFRRGTHDPATGSVTPEGGPGSHLLSALARANCLVEIPEDVTSVPAGAQVVIRVLE
ncbi:molybdopterin molybdotransferase MoeA [Salinifilum ghardaiensis]